MKIAVLGAGFAGLSASLELNRAGFEVHLFERADKPGGAAGGFKRPDYDWYLDYAYHHAFSNEQEIFALAKLVGAPPFLVGQPETASLYLEESATSTKNDLFNYLFGTSTAIYKLDTPADLLRFPRLPPLDRLRTGLVLAALKFGPKLNDYDRVTAKEFLSRTMGQKSYRELWEPLFLKKFAGHEDKINMSFFWARLRRTAKLCYPPGGYQALANQILSYLKKQGVKVHLNSEIMQIRKINNQFELGLSSGTARFEMLLSTLQSPLFLRLEKGVLPESYAKRLAKIEYLGAQNLIFESKTKVLPQTYWLSIAAQGNNPGLKWMVAVQQTNFIDPKHYNHKHLIYMATYTNSPLNFKLPEKLAQKYKLIQKAYLKYAQPLFTPEFVRLKPDFATPVPKLFFANMEQTYPFDRGTSNAIRVGRFAADRMVSFSKQASD